MPDLLETNCPDLNLWRRGKVRDMYDLGDSLLMAATDRISAYDVVMPNPVPRKGQTLTAISLFWFEHTGGIVPNHLLTADIQEMPPAVQAYSDQLEGRVMRVQKAERIDIECVVRGYISGSAWREYRQSGTVCGEEMPKGLLESQRLETPIFTPATKEDEGHDINISRAEMAKLTSQKLADQLEQISVQLYESAAEYASERGIIIADTKFEFGTVDGEIILIDEVLTPDSSRFWPLDEFEPGRTQRSFDKQPLRDYLDTLDWDKTPPAPELPASVIDGTSRRYQKAYELLVD